MAMSTFVFHIGIRFSYANDYSVNLSRTYDVTELTFGPVQSKLNTFIFMKNLVYFLRPVQQNDC